VLAVDIFTIRFLEEPTPPDRLDIAQLVCDARRS
jgi:hypothetical protein